jgi:hypothetical protein
MNASIIYKEHGINIMRRDFDIRNRDENEKNVLVFIKDMIAKGIIDQKKILNEVNNELSQVIVNSMESEANKITEGIFNNAEKVSGFINKQNR